MKRLRSNQDVDWDKRLEEETYNSILDGMSDARLITPSMFSSDRKSYYLKTRDYAVAVDDYEFISEDLKGIKKEFIGLYNKLKEKCCYSTIERLYLLQIDYITLYHLLSSNEAETLEPLESLWDGLNKSTH